MLEITEYPGGNIDKPVKSALRPKGTHREISEQRAGNAQQRICILSAASRAYERVLHIKHMVGYNPLEDNIEIRYCRPQRFRSADIVPGASAYTFQSSRTHLMYARADRADSGDGVFDNRDRIGKTAVAAAIAPADKDKPFGKRA